MVLALPPFSQIVFFISIQVKVLRERLTNEIKVERERRKRVEEKVRFNDL
jgi:hypothetical protein